MTLFFLKLIPNVCILESMGANPFDEIRKFKLIKAWNALKTYGINAEDQRTFNEHNVL